MDINISILINSEFNPHDVYGSVATHGEDVAGITWSAAFEYAEVLPNFLDTDEKVAEFCDRLSSYGYDMEELNHWGLMDFAALFLQMVAAEMVEAGFDPQNPDWDLLNESGSNIFGGPHSVDGEAYFSF